MIPMAKLTPSDPASGFSPMDFNEFQSIIA
jgi:hypothetical protein